MKVKLGIKRILLLLMPQLNAAREGGQAYYSSFISPQANIWHVALCYMSYAESVLTVSLVIAHAHTPTTPGSHTTCHIMHIFVAVVGSLYTRREQE